MPRGNSAVSDKSAEKPGSVQQGILLLVVLLGLFRLCGAPLPFSSG